MTKKFLMVCFTVSFYPWGVFATESISYSPHSAYPISVEPFLTAGIALGDIDGDGDLDMVEANGRHWPQANYIYFNAQNRGLTKRVRLGAYDLTGYTVKLADLDGDGDLDVAQASDKQQNQIYLNDGAGYFSGMPQFDASLPLKFGDISDRTLSVRVADMNGDGQVDLVLANRDAGQNKILLGLGKLRFGAPINFGSGEDDTRGLVVVDMNGDGRPDIVTANIGEANGVVLNRGSGNFELTQRFGEGEGRSYAILTHDLDGDGDADIIVGNVASKSRVYLNDGKGQLALLAEIGTGEENTYALGVGDINGDGLPDIITGNSESANIVYYQTRGSD